MKNNENYYEKSSASSSSNTNTDHSNAKHSNDVKNVIFNTVKGQKFLFGGIVVTVLGAIITALIPPLILAKFVDRITSGKSASFLFILLYFIMLAITGLMESAREGLLTVFGQKITHGLRSSLMEKFINLTTDNINKQEPGNVSIQICRRCRYCRESLHIRNHQYVCRCM